VEAVEAARIGNELRPLGLVQVGRSGGLLAVGSTCNWASH
jgi:hypothetical protein